MTRGSATANAGPLLNFQLCPVGALRNWRNMLNKQQFVATLQQPRDVMNKDNLETKVANALQRANQQQIKADNTLTPNTTVHFTMQSNNFTHTF